MRELYTTTVTVTGGRDGHAASDDGRLAIALAMPKALGGTGESANPEQLFAAGFGACFNSSIRFAARARRIDAGDVVVEATATLIVNADGAFGIKAKLAVKAPGLKGDDRDAVIAEAKRVCAYTNATRGNVETTIEILD
jgi:lipoyl-dependent peroxiredoxin